MQRFRFLWLMVFLGVNTACTNYSVSKSKTVPPILIAINPIADVTSGYRIKMRVVNQELFFAGYKLYIGKDENAARNPSDLNSGENCATGLPIIPNQAAEYIVEVSPDPTKLPAVGGRLCTYQRTLVAGEYIALRTLLFSIQLSNQSGSRINPSQPSNTLIVP